MMTMNNDNGHRPKAFAAMSSAAPPQLKKFPHGMKTKHNIKDRHSGGSSLRIIRTA
jgi:hypothetical protein